MAAPYLLDEATAEKIQSTAMHEAPTFRAYQVVPFTLNRPARDADALRMVHWWSYRWGPNRTFFLTCLIVLRQDQ